MRKRLAELQQFWVERCPECEGTTTGDHTDSGFITCFDCGHFWPEGMGKRVYSTQALV